MSAAQAISNLFDRIASGRRVDEETVNALARQINQYVLASGKTKELRRIVNCGMEQCVRVCLNCGDNRERHIRTRQEKAVMLLRAIVLRVKQRDLEIEEQDRFPIWTQDLLIKHCLKVMLEDKIAGKQDKPTSAYRLVLVVTAYSSAIQTNSVRNKFYVILQFLTRNTDPYRWDPFLKDRIFITKRVGGIGKNYIP